MSPGGAEDKCFCQGEICLATVTLAPFGVRAADLPSAPPGPAVYAPPAAYRAVANWSGFLHSFRAKVAAAAALVLASAQTAGLSQPAGKLSITVTGVRNSDGVVRCALFNSPAAFPKIGQEWRGG